MVTDWSTSSTLQHYWHNCSRLDYLATLTQKYVGEPALVLFVALVFQLLCFVCKIITKIHDVNKRYRPNAIQNWEKNGRDTMKRA